MSLVDTNWLQENIDKVKIIDCSWHMPQTKRNGFDEYQKEHIKNAIFFDLDKNSNQNTDLPHMLTDLNSWEKIMSGMGINNNDEIVIYDNSDVISSCRCWYNLIFFDLDKNSKIDTDLPHMLTDINSWELIMNSMGISNEDEIVIYDNSDVISSCRCWYNLIYFGHDPKLVHVLDGGLKKWKIENKITNNEIIPTTVSNYKAIENNKLVKNKQEIDKNIALNEFIVVDARSRERFEGKVPEPRKGLRSGSIKNSFCIPFNKCLNDNKTFKNKEDLENIFKSCLGNYNENNIVFSCGSGVTACVLALAYSLINDKYHPCIYDGSWAEYGMV